MRQQSEMAEDTVRPPRLVRMLNRVLDELGLVSVHRSTLDTKLLIVQRFVRLFAYGGSTLILVAYLRAVGNSDAEIGMFMTLTLFGDVLISFFLTLVADALGRKVILIVGAALMSLSGIVFALSANYWILLLAATIGVISPNGNEIGPFRAIEESTLAYLSSPNTRADIFAWQSLLGFAGTAFGMMACGWVVHLLQYEYGWQAIHAYRIVFYAYAALGGVKLLLTLSLSSKIEIEQKPAPLRDQEAAPLLGEVQLNEVPREKRSVLPKLSKESRSILVKLTLLFILDNFATGLASLSWVTYFFQRKFDLEEGYLGSLFFTTTIISALSVLVAASIARRLGNIKTMVFTHLPSAIGLAGMALPNSLPLSLAFLILRSCSQNMDVAPRSAFLASVVLPSERTSVMGYLNVVKTCAQSFGPLVTGVLAGKNLFWVAFLLAGGIKVIYDIGMLVVFVGQKSREEEQE